MPQQTRWTLFSHNRVVERRRPPFRAVLSIRTRLTGWRRQSHLPWKLRQSGWNRIGRNPNRLPTNQPVLLMMISENSETPGPCFHPGPCRLHGQRADGQGWGVRFGDDHLNTEVNRDATLLHEQRAEINACRQAL
ncbi:hypothetical protein LX36DRAFT_280639 [Colletotrichum falcatum]|nr:hypothetical protein LX36DRAFT_280639 [Colletotrichum falcatum]